MELRRTYKLRNREAGIWFSSGLRDLSKHLRESPGDTFFVIDGKVAEWWHPELPENRTVRIKGGDRMKTAEQMKLIQESALKAGATEKTRFVAIGGGVTIDLTATCICAYFRGAPFTAIPTTLMAMTDAAVGGRCGLNSGSERYVLRDYCQADTVIIEADFLGKTGLSSIRNGFGEIIKHSLLSPSTRLIDTLFSRKKDIVNLERKAMEDVVLQSMDIKASYLHVADTNPVAETVLELGHRFGFAFMLDGEGGLRHGEAVVWGIARALRLGLEKGMTDRIFASRAMQLFDLYEYDTGYRFPQGRVLRLLDAYNGVYGLDAHQFILMKAQGEPFFYSADQSEVTHLLC